MSASTQAEEVQGELMGYTAYFAIAVWINIAASLPVMIRLWTLPAVFGFICLIRWQWKRVCYWFLIRTWWFFVLHATVFFGYLIIIGILN